MENTSQFQTDRPHSLILEERRRMQVSGVSEVLRFDEEQMVMETSLGQLTIEGEGLHVEKLSLDVGELTLEGSVLSLCYSREGKSRGSFWSRVF